MPPTTRLRRFGDSSIRRVAPLFIVCLLAPLFIGPSAVAQTSDSASDEATAITVDPPAAMHVATAEVTAAAQPIASDRQGEFDVYSWNIFGRFYGNITDSSNYYRDERATIGRTLAKVISTNQRQAIVGLQEDWQSKSDCVGAFHTRKHVFGRPGESVLNGVSIDNSFMPRYVSLPGDTRFLAGNPITGVNLFACDWPLNDGINLYSSFPFVNSPRCPNCERTVNIGSVDGDLYVLALGVGAQAYYPWLGTFGINAWHPGNLGHTLFRETFEVREDVPDDWGWPGDIAEKVSRGIWKCGACKGFMYSRVEVSPGVMVDVYNLHFGPFQTAQSNQVIEAINEISGGPEDLDRYPVILMGDTNLHWVDEQEFVDLGGAGFIYDPVESRKKCGGAPCAFPTTVTEQQIVFNNIKAQTGLNSACQTFGLDEVTAEELAQNPLRPGACITDPETNGLWTFPKSGVIDQIFYRDSEALRFEVTDYEVLECRKVSCDGVGDFDPTENEMSDHAPIRARLGWTVNGPPSADADGPYQANEGASIQLDGTGSTDPDGDDLTYLWAPDTHLDDPTSATPTYQAVDDTQDTLTLTVTDPFGLSDSNDTTVTVVNVAPAIVELAATDSDEMGITTLTGSFTDPGTADTHLVEVEWGDNSFDLSYLDAGARDFEFTHQFVDDDPTATSADDYTIVVKVVDDDGGADTEVTTVTVTNVDPVVSIDSIADELTGQPISFTIDDKIVDPGAMDVVIVGNGLQAIGSYTDVGIRDLHYLPQPPGADNPVIDWGDGSSSSIGVAASGADAIAAYGTTETASHTYATSLTVGQYPISLTVTDDDTGTATAVASIRVVDALGALKDAQNDLQALLDQGSLSGGAADDVRRAVSKIGGNSGSASGAISHLERGNLNPSRVKIEQAIEFLVDAKAEHGAVEVTPTTTQLALAAKSIVETAIVQAEGAADKRNEIRKLDQAKGHRADGNAALATLDYLTSIDAYGDAMTALQGIK